MLWFYLLLGLGLGAVVLLSWVSFQVHHRRTESSRPVAQPADEVINRLNTVTRRLEDTSSLLAAQIDLYMDRDIPQPPPRVGAHRQGAHNGDGAHA